MLDIENYMDRLINVLKNDFGSRLLYVGLQGSYLRNEADEKSDIDIMVVLENLAVADLVSYKTIIEKIGNSEKSCGFMCGKPELNNWNPLEICQLVNTTKDFYGRLSEHVPAYTAKDHEKYIKLCLNNLYHEICHRYIHASKEKNALKLPASCKSVFFILQNIYFQKTGIYFQTRNELLAQLTDCDKEVLLMASNIKNYPYDFDKAFKTLFAWCKNAMIEL